MINSIDSDNFYVEYWTVPQNKIYKRVFKKVDGMNLFYYDLVVDCEPNIYL